MSIAHQPPPVIPPQVDEGIYTRHSGRVIRTRVVLLGLDVLAISLSHLLPSLLGLSAGSWDTACQTLAVSVFLLPVLLYLNDAYALAFVQSAVKMSRALCRALPAYLGIGFVLHLAFPNCGLRGGELALALLSAGTGVSLTRAFLFSSLKKAKGSYRVIIIGAGWSGRTIAENLLDCPGGHFDVVGFVDDDPEKVGREIVRGAAVLGSTAELARLAIEYQAAEVILAITEQIPDRLYTVLGMCEDLGVRTVPMANLYEEITGRVPVKHISDRWFLYCFAPESQRLYEVIKRSVDIVASIVAIPFVLVLSPAIALAILRESGRPVLYRQVRVGRGERNFAIVKFRTMVQNAEANGAVWAAENDARVTPLGAWLRRTRLDEVPQLWNVLKGEMSLIGPRPERPEFVRQLSREIPFYNRRHAVLPGITGWAQVKYPYGASVEDALQKLQYDLYYIKHRSLFLDFIIALKTIVTMLTRQGR